MDITKLISDVGFPMVCAIVGGFYIWKIQQQNRDDSIKREDRMFTQLDKFGDSLDSFNHTLTKIDKRLEDVEKKIEDKLD